MTTQNSAACLMGALAADAASLGLHWLYDPARIAEVVGARGAAAFTPVDPANYNGVPGYFAHGSRKNGALSQYGEVLSLATRCMIASAGRFDDAAFQAAYAAYFGPGGAYVGYIDRPTRGTLANLAAGQTEPSGIDDDQLPAIATLPAIVVANLGASDLSTTVARAIRITNVNDAALDYGMAFAALLSMVLGGTPVAQALQAIATGAGGTLGESLRNALQSPASSVDFGAETGRACHLPMGLPLAFHILTRARSFADAVEVNIRAGGDSAGRAIIIGAVMGAAHGIQGQSGIPPAYLLAMQDGANLWAQCETLAQFAAA
ncbi:ADP-ribosylglycohydrolase family protein [Pseudorhodobacter sp.]|uniref:ADP-ribosylglycohydrolase family protein n=1 Tax=Pseudorhodobacter sp. TaxID=1934400 RepID=UPI002648027F|nr:ADP-ribosylglycohydrolase family protein [Pseudorhodobacter sp.]MDN5786945.1 ADP-ribosylglycohydrolase family protein [Pseudorhodobacter sp.]